jgi:hypothetical protein
MQSLDMDESNVWGAQRIVTLFVVLALHLAILALLFVVSPSRLTPASADNSVELMFLPPTKVPKVHFENAPLQRLNAYTAISITLPGLDSPSLSPPSSGTDGNNASAVNWEAEAHRAVQAVEIRRIHPPTVAISSSSSWTDWWPREHRIGDRFKTENGDWIVWISASCYQIARWGPGALGSTPSQTIICSRQPDAPRGEGSLPAPKTPDQ